ncbi:MAG TPA: hypothetical protein DCX54_11770 [Flavobacteriales bacterium]|nr:hypothetical protein [Flavobacteriales bacterium]
MKKYYKYFLVIGFLIGFLDGIRIAVISYMQAPSLPGVYEVLVQIGISLFFAFLYTFYAFLIWGLLFLGEKIYRKSKQP